MEILQCDDNLSHKETATKKGRWQSDIEKMELAKNLELHGFWKDIIAFPPNHNRELFDSDFLFFFQKKRKNRTSRSVILKKLKIWKWWFLTNQIPDQQWLEAGLCENLYRTASSENALHGCLSRSAKSSPPGQKSVMRQTWVLVCTFPEIKTHNFNFSGMSPMING